MATRNASISYARNEYGGRLRYVGAQSTPEFWDDRWTQGEATTRYARAKAGYMPRHLLRPLLKWVAAGGSVLEAGCGPARFTVAAHARGYRAVGVDFAPLVVARLTKMFPEIPFIVGDVTCLRDVPTGSYDAVYSPGVCEHFEAGPEPVLRETFRVLKLGGIALVHTPYFNPFRRFLVRLGAFRRTRHGEFYQYAFGGRELTARLESVGFKVVDVAPFDTWSTLTDHIPGLARLPLGPFERPVERLADRLPILRAWGHCAMWVARKPGDGTA